MLGRHIYIKTFQYRFQFLKIAVSKNKQNEKSLLARFTCSIHIRQIRCNFLVETRRAASLELRNKTETLIFFRFIKMIKQTKKKVRFIKVEMIMEG